MVTTGDTTTTTVAVTGTTIIVVMMMEDLPITVGTIVTVEEGVEAAAGADPGPNHV